MVINQNFGNTNIGGNKKLASDISEITTQAVLELPAEQQKAILEVLNKKENTFEAVEIKVLNSLPKGARKRLLVMKNRLLTNKGPDSELVYLQIIQQLDRKEVEILKNSVKFWNAGKEVFTQELQVEGKDIVPMDNCFENNEKNNINNNKIMYRTTIEQRVFNKKTHPSYKIVKDALELERKKGKQWATYDNTFKVILDSFKGTEQQKIRAMQFLIGFVGKIFISEESISHNEGKPLDKEEYIKKDAQLPKKIIVEDAFDSDFYRLVLRLRTDLDALTIYRADQGRNEASILLSRDL